MKRRYKILVGLGVLVLLLVGAGVFIFTDENRQRAFLIFAIETTIGATIEIEGDVSFSIGQISSFSAERLTVALPKAGTSGTVGRLRVSIDTWSAVKGPLIVEEILIEQSDIRVASLPGLDDAPAEGDHKEVSLPLIKRIEIINMQLDIPIPSPDDFSTITADELTVLQRSDGRELEIAGEGLFDDIPLGLTGGVGPFDETADGAVNAPIRVAITSSGGRTTLEGTVFDFFRDAQLDLAITARSAAGSVLNRVTEPLGLQNAQLSLEGKLLGPAARPRIDDLEASIASDGASLVLFGAIGDVVGGAGMDLDFDGSFAGDFLYGRFADLPRSLGLERLEARGHVRGAISRAEFSGLNIGAQFAGQTGFLANGQVTLANILNKLDITSADLALQLTAPNAQLLGALIDDNLAGMGPIQGTAHLAGSRGKVALERIDLLAGKDGPVRLRVIGRIPWIAGDAARGLEAAELRGQLSGDNVKDLSPLLGVDLPSVGPIELDTAMEFRGDDLFFTDTTIGISGPDELRISASGSARVRDLPGDSFLDSIDAAVEISSATSTAFLQTIDIELPELGATAGTVRITGNEDTIAARSIDIRFRDPSELNVTATGQISEIDLRNNGIVRDLDLRLTADAPSLAVVAQRLNLELADLGAARAGAEPSEQGESPVTTVVEHMDFELPDLGAVRASAHLLGKRPADAIAVDTFSVSVGPEAEPVLSIAGTFDNIVDPQNGVMNASVRADAAGLSKAMDWPVIAGLIIVRADMQLSARDGSLGIEHLTLDSENTDSISITALGAIDDLLNFDQVDVDIELKAADADIFAPALQGLMRPKGALAVEGKVIIAKPEMNFIGGLRLGENDIEARLSGSTADERPHLSGQIAAKRLSLEDFGVDAASRDSLVADLPDGREGQRDYVFGKDPLPFDNLFAVDLDLAVTAETGRGLGYDFETLRANVNLQDGRLRLDPFDIVYDRGKVEYAGVIDASVNPPAVEIEIRATDFELAELLLYVQDEPKAAGALTGNFEMASRGASPRELAQNLSGSADLAIENGRVNGINLHVLSTETFEYLVSLPNLKQSTEINCGIARFEIAGGVAKSEAILLATPRMTLSGSGWIDFGAEKMDIAMTADPKSFVPVFFKKPVRFHGEFTDLGYSTTGAQSGLFGGVFGQVAGFVAAPFIFAPVSAAGGLVDLLRENGDGSPCLVGE